MAGQPHHRDRRYVVLGQRVIDLANANPHAVCWRDGWTLEQHRVRFPGRRLKWHRGHTRKGSRTWQPWLNVTQQPPDGDWLAPEISACNIGHGNREREPHSEIW
jgi:hypothetical protein